MILLLPERKGCKAPKVFNIALKDMLENLVPERYKKDKIMFVIEDIKEVVENSIP